MARYDARREPIDPGRSTAQPIPSPSSPPLLFFRSSTRRLSAQRANGRSRSGNGRMTREHGFEARKPAGPLRSCAQPAARVDGEHAPRKSGHLAQRPVPSAHASLAVHTCRSNVSVCVVLGRRRALPRLEQGTSRRPARALCESRLRKSVSTTVADDCQAPGPPLTRQSGVSYRFISHVTAGKPFEQAVVSQQPAHQDLQPGPGTRKAPSWAWGTSARTSPLLEQTSRADPGYSPCHCPPVPGLASS